MTDLYCMTGRTNCGCGTNFSNNPPPTLGLGGKCPKCGMPHGEAGISGGAVAATGRAICPKCGLMQHGRTLGTIKRAYNPLRCRDCNQPNIVDDEGGTYWYCIRCGRIYDCRYANRHGNGSVAAGLIRCPKCGGNTKGYVGT